ncbi:MAG: hypothetical protein J6I54_00580 [Bacteroidaceae bacterium]|nr:hypothetical protein [Bacteroidaceae bacterium]
MRHNNARDQLIDAANEDNGFAITLLGVYLINSQEDVEAGTNLIMLAADAKNVLWAKSLRLYLQGFGDRCEIPIESHALLDSYAREQLERYAAGKDIWAMTVLGNLLYHGRVLPRDIETARTLLCQASNMGCLFAAELLEEYELTE